MAEPHIVEIAVNAALEPHEINMSKSPCLLVRSWAWEVGSTWEEQGRGAINRGLTGGGGKQVMAKVGLEVDPPLKPMKGLTPAPSHSQTEHQGKPYCPGGL